MNSLPLSHDTLLEIDELCKMECPHLTLKYVYKPLEFGLQLICKRENEIRERRLKILFKLSESNIPHSEFHITRVLVAPNYVKSSRMTWNSFNDKVIHWIYDIEQGGKEKDLTMIIKKHLFSKMQLDREAQVDKLLKSKPEYIWLKVHHINFLVNFY
eukprot:NODE_847_length_3554_cov_0.525036.p4 type:complete len:157 gc:universal NODE_847_length_3554_cov_0.525036:2758-2288(-)